ncbi:hypothetical protein LX32DRAFT_414547 [Colletotrichum zoysiae]|uniref:Uncharacterized protein n=1 Tax=Colletotrichum zoysiae TaxID=1216348 RepID=A0AAD9HH68_9PEZI|nr:hypothetical protein LX32DRAFT_414547 [Colletotrichum zoysiae]
MHTHPISVCHPPMHLPCPTHTPLHHALKDPRLPNPGFLLSTACCSSQLSLIDPLSLSPSLTRTHSLARCLDSPSPIHQHCPGLCVVVLTVLLPITSQVLNTLPSSHLKPAYAHPAHICQKATNSHP